MQAESGEITSDKVEDLDITLFTFYLHHILDQVVSKGALDQNVGALDDHIR